MDDFEKFFFVANSDPNMAMDNIGARSAVGFRRKGIPSENK
jgi:hypothetical protein